MTNENPSSAELQEMIDGKTADMYQNVETIQKELGKVEVEGKSDQNLVKIILSGEHVVKGLSINPDLLKGSNKDVEDAILTAFKDAKTKVEEQVKIKMVEVAQTLGFYDQQ